MIDSCGIDRLALLMVDATLALKCLLYTGWVINQEWVDMARTSVFKERELLRDRALETMLEHSETGIAVIDRQLIYRFINPVLARFNGPSVEEHVGRSIHEVLPELAPMAAPLLQRVLDHGEPLRNFEIRVPTPSVQEEDSLWLASYLPIWSEGKEQSEVIGILAIAENETLVKKLERSRREASELVQRVIDSLYAFVGILALDGTVLDCNRAPLEAAGIDIKEVAGHKFWECLWWNYDQDLQAQLQFWIQAAARGEIIRQDVVVRMANDSRMTIDFMLAPLRDANGHITHLIPSASDVSDRVASEQQLKASEDRFRRVVDSTLNALLLIDNEGNIHLANQRAAEMFGYPMEQLMNLRVDDLVPIECRHHHKGLRSGYFQHPEARAMALRQELFACRQDGSLFPVEVGLTPLWFSEGMRVLATVVDVSVQKSNQAELVRALEEKTVLLNEVHHRVKNNLQVVSSLLSLQARNVPEDARVYLQESQDRIRAMALIHQLLYEQKSFDRVDIASYAQRLMGLLRRSYLTGPGIRVVMDAPEQLFVPLEVAQPFGLLLNELVTNSIKHAFRGRDSGEICLTMEEAGDLVRIRIADDGVGLPGGVEIGKGRSLGFQLVPGLVEQMGAQLARLDVAGTCFELTFSRGGV